jgi:hypothetical protein
MHFHPGWSGPTEGFGYRGYYIGDDNYRYVGHQQDRRTSGQENRIVQNGKSDHPVSSTAATVPGCQHKQGAPNDGSSANRSRSNQGQSGLRGKTSVNDEAKPDAEKGPKEMVAEQDRVPGAETKTEVVTSSQWPPSWTVDFQNLISLGLGQKGMLRTTVPGTDPTPHWCTLGLTSSQRRRIQWMRAQKMREEAPEKKRDKHFNDIRLVIPMRQEWRVKGKVDTSAPMTSNDDMDLLDDDEAPL